MGAKGIKNDDVVKYDNNEDNMILINVPFSLH